MSPSSNRMVSLQKSHRLGPSIKLVDCKMCFKADDTILHCVADSVHCFLYDEAGWPSLSRRCYNHWYLFIYKAFVGPCCSRSNYPC